MHEVLNHYLLLVSAASPCLLGVYRLLGGQTIVKTCTAKFVLSIEQHRSVAATDLFTTIARGKEARRSELMEVEWAG